MSDLTPETLAELRRLYEVAFSVAAPENDWEEWTSKAAEAFPALLHAAAERDRLARLLDEPRRSGCAVEIAGVRIVPCDERGQTADMLAADRLRRELAEAELAAQRTVRLPTVAECRQARKDVLIDNWDWHASAVLDLVASLNPTWVEVPPDATIPAGTLVRAEYQEYANRAKEWATEVDRTPAMWQSGVVYLVPSGTVLEFPLDPRVESVARAIHDAGKSEYIWDNEPASVRDNYVRLAKAAIDAIGEDI